LTRSHGGGPPHERCIHVEEPKLRATVLPKLMGRVFHTTTHASYKQILQTGSILPNEHGRFPSNFAFGVPPYFQERGCVSVCDLRVGVANELEDWLSKYDCVKPRWDWFSVAYLFLGAMARERLITWDQAVKEDGLTIHGAPHIEAGHPGAIPVSDLEEILLIEVIPDSGLEALRSIHRQRKKQ
jgi:hypothetical protein